ncbi:MAG: DUF4040 domain-containing protein [bacterium]|nr:DUF4040 domain-containing protein [bacterium]
MPEALTALSLAFLVACAVAVAFIRDLVYAVVIFGAYSLVMALVWNQMSAPDMAITEAAAGTAMTVLMVGVIIRTRRRET